MAYKKMKFNLTFASVQAEREMENAKHTERERGRGRSRVRDDWNLTNAFYTNRNV
jgi:hypothetical protein